MIFIISPAKQMVQTNDMFEHTTLPCCIEQAQCVLETLQSMTDQELQTLWNCSDTLAEQNIKRVRTMDLRHGLTPAIMSYVGIQYQHLAASVMDEQQLLYIQSHLRIISGLYGVVRPFDGITPYRLEMQARLPVDGSYNLYDYWGSSIAKRIAAEINGQTNEDCVVVNVASTEYSKAVVGHCSEYGVDVVTCLFGTLQDGKLKQCSTEAKAARGTFINWCASQGVVHVCELEAFNMQGYKVCKELSDNKKLVFIH